VPTCTRLLLTILDTCHHNIIILTLLVIWAQVLPCQQQVNLLLKSSLAEKVERRIHLQAIEVKEARLLRETCLHQQETVLVL
jgi:hypothetical protein